MSICHVSNKQELNNLVDMLSLKQEQKKCDPSGCLLSFGQETVDKECKVFIALNNTGLLHQFFHQSKNISYIAYLVKFSIISVMIDKDRNNYAS